MWRVWRVGCVCTCGVVCGVGGVCVVVLWWCVCVVCGEAWHTLSLLLSLLPHLFPFRFPLLFLSLLFFSLLFLFLFLFVGKCEQTANKPFTKSAFEDI